MKVFSSSYFGLSIAVLGSLTLVGLNLSLPVTAPPQGSLSASSSSPRVVSAQLILRSPALVLKPSEHPHLVQHAPSAGLFTDGPPHPWRDDVGNIYVNIPHSENFRYLIGNAKSFANPWDTPNAWQLQQQSIFDSRVDLAQGGAVYHKGGNCLESDYDNRFWLFGFWSFGKRVAALAHHEWYAQCAHGYNTLNSNPKLFNTHWVNAIGHFTSEDAGNSFLPRALQSEGNAPRLVVVPEPKSVQNPAIMYGFFHPSNIVKEDNYFYAAVEVRQFLGKRNAKGREVVTAGFTFIRTPDVMSSRGWEIFDENKKWTAMSGYQGNRGQKPYIFFANDVDPYESASNAGSMAMTLRYHPESAQWLAFGAYEGRYTILQSDSLGAPAFDSNLPIQVEGLDASYPYYISVFDPSKYNDATDLNYVNVGNNLLMLHMKNYEGYAMYDVKLTVGAAGSGSGLFKYSGGMYYSNGGSYCAFPNMELFTARTGRVDDAGILPLATLPAGFTNSGSCR